MIELYNMSRQDYLYSISGGVLLGITTTLFFLVFGKFLEVTSPIRDVLKLKIDSHKVTIIAGIIFSGALVRTLYNEHIIAFWPFDGKRYMESNQPVILILSGFMVAIGSVMGKGCIFTHVVSGIPHLNFRSILATILITVSAYYTYELNLKKTFQDLLQFQVDVPLSLNMAAEDYLLPCLLVPFLCFIFSKGKSAKDLVEYMIVFFLSALFGASVMISGFATQKKVYQLLHYDSSWSPRMLVFLGIPILINFITYRLIKRNQVPLLVNKFDIEVGRFTIGELIGPIIFGVGWALTGFTIGTVYLFIPLKTMKVTFYWGLSCCAGLKLMDLFEGVGNRLNRNLKK